MQQTFDFRYQHTLEQDHNFNGVFLACVHSTGVYCLPSCTIKKNQRENICFFDNEMDAKAEGFRPCKRCKPDLFYTGPLWEGVRWQKVVNQIRKSTTLPVSTLEWAEWVGLSFSEMTELCQKQAERELPAWVQSERLRLAKQLQQRGVPDLQILATRCGFVDISALERAFIDAHGVTANTWFTAQGNSLTLTLPPNFNPEGVLNYFARDREQLSERVQGQKLQKLLSTPDGPVLLEIEFELNGKTAECRLPLHPEATSITWQVVLVAVARMLGLQHDLNGFAIRADKNVQIAHLLEGKVRIRPPQTASNFEALVWAIVGQQVNLAFATFLRRVVIRLGGQQVCGTDLILHPDAAAVAAIPLDKLLANKFSRTKAQYLLLAAEAVVTGKLKLDELQISSASLAAQKLQSLKGIGPWSASYIMLRGFGFGNCVPVGDTGLTEALKRFYGMDTRPNAQQTIELMRTFYPHATLATCQLWASLNYSNS